MDVTVIIPKILSAKTIADILNVSDLESEFKQIRRLIHPDICPHADAEAAFKKLYELKLIWTDGQSYLDESGEFKSNGFIARFYGTKSLLQTSLRNYDVLKAARKSDFEHEHFQKYLPKKMEMKGDVLEVTMDKRAIPLSDLIKNNPLSQEHVNWVLSRMLEFSALLNQIKYVHCGLNPESVFVIPENHGIQVMSFYHMAPLHSQVKTICGRYKNWYPTSLFSNKLSQPLIDCELAKRTAIYLLGDKSGSGIKLKKTHNKDFIDFVIKQNTDVVMAFKEYREMLKRNFPDNFHILNI